MEFNINAPSNIESFVGYYARKWITREFRGRIELHANIPSDEDLGKEIITIHKTDYHTLLESDKIFNKQSYGLCYHDMADVMLLQNKDFDLSIIEKSQPFGRDMIIYYERYEGGKRKNKVGFLIPLTWLEYYKNGIGFRNLLGDLLYYIDKKDISKPSFSF